MTETHDEYDSVYWYSSYTTTNVNHGCVREIILQKLRSLLHKGFATVNTYCTVVSRAFVN
jgi:hypothetical protein